MGKLLYTQQCRWTVLLPDRTMKWIGFSKYDSDKMVDEIMKEIGAVVLGKRTFDISLEKNQLPYGAC